MIANAVMQEIDVVPPVKRLISRFESQTNLVFKPTSNFYKVVGINAFRFAQLIRGEKNLDSVEIKNLTGYFGQFFPVKAEDLLWPAPTTSWIDQPEQNENWARLSKEIATLVCIAEWVF